MTLQRKTFYVLALTTLATLVVLSFASRAIVLSSFEKLEREEASQNVLRILSALSDKLEALRNSTKDWAQWDDTYQYIQDKNEDYYKTNLEASTSFLNLRVNFMAYVRNSGEIVFYKAVDLNTQEEIQAWESLKSYFAADSMLLKHPDLESEVKGFISVPEGLVLVASLPIATSSREGPIHGSIIFGRYFDSKEIERLSKTTLFSLTVRRIAEPFLPSDFQDALPLLKQSPSLVRTIGPDLIAGYALIKDISGEPVVILRAEMPRKIFQQGQSTLAFFNLVLLFVALTFVLVVILLIRQVVLSRLSRLMKDVGTIAQSGESSKGVGVYGKDELAHLGASINKMLESLEQSKSELAKSEKRFQLAAQATNDVIWDWDLLTGELWWNENFQKVFGYGEEESKKGLEAWTKHLHPEDRDSVISGIHAAIERGERFWSAEYRFARVDGSYAFILDRGYVMHDEKGKAVRMLGAMQDITDRKRLQEQMLHAHRIDAVGRLAGGMAHDFNNLMTAILGYGILISKNTKPGEQMHEDAEEILTAGNRAKKLTNQLLSFSRQQLVQAETIHFGNFLSGKEAEIRELVGNRVELTILPGRDLGFIRMDVSQLWEVLQQVLKNAVEAMPEGGKIIVEAANLDLDKSYAERYQDIHTGPYVMLAVTDGGVGMTPEVKAQLFEPFFTTKALGQHEGLGLATAFGIVKQAGGYLFVYSETNGGTTVKICLPRYEEKKKAHAVIAAKPAAALSTAGHETILLSEDEPMVRSLSGRVLREQGYTVLEAISGVDAMQLVQRFPDRKIDLLLTDVVMPQMGGKELSEKIKSLKPGVKLLFISGYTDEAVVRQGILDRKIPFLQKPFTPQGLASKVREVLDS